jgi:hypothetical protein
VKRFGTVLALFIMLGSVTRASKDHLVTEPMVYLLVAQPVPVGATYR